MIIFHVSVLKTGLLVFRTGLRYAPLPPGIKWERGMVLKEQVERGPRISVSLEPSQAWSPAPDSLSIALSGFLPSSQLQSW